MTRRQVLKLYDKCGNKKLTDFLLWIMFEAMGNFNSGVENGRILRDIEIKCNGYFSTHYDLEKDKLTVFPNNKESNESDV